MTANEKKLAIVLLEMAGEEFSNHGCNDFELSQYIPDQAERDELVRAYHEWNGDLKEMEENGWLKQTGERDYRLHDYAVMDFIAHRLESEVKR